MAWNEKQQGMSLVELLVAMAILGVALVPLLGVFSHALKMTEHANKRTIATNLVRDLQEEVRSKAFWEPNPPGGQSIYFPNTTTRQSFGCEECKASPAGTGAFTATTKRYLKFDDIDDYDGWCEGRDCGSTAFPCTGTVSTDGLCSGHPILTAYDGTPYAGPGYPHYQDYTRMVQVYNIWENVSTVKGREPRLHRMSLGVGDYRKESPFSFFDLRPERGFKNLTSDRRSGYGRARGKTNLKMIIVTVSYSGPFTPTFTVSDRALVAASVK